jgi:hypothetical protein
MACSGFRSHLNLKCTHAHTSACTHTDTHASLKKAHEILLNEGAGLQYLFIHSFILFYLTREPVDTAAPELSVKDTRNKGTEWAAIRSSLKIIDCDRCHVKKVKQGYGQIFFKRAT